MTSPPPRGPPDLGVVIPTLDEERTLPDLLSDLEALAVPIEVVVADGGSSDDTVGIARRRGVRTILAPRGRGTQMNAGARSLETRWILFLHADSRLPTRTREALLRWLADPPGCEAAHFEFALDQSGLWWRMIEQGQRIRERLTGLTYGDQGLLLSRTVFDEIEGIPEIPVMEDVEAVRRLRGNGGLDRISAPVVTSARRYLREGPVRGWLRNVTLISLYAAGVSPRILSRWYRPYGSTPRG